MYNYQKSNRFFAQCADDIKDIAADEIRALGAEEISASYRGLYFNADRETLYKINFHTRLLNRILAPLLSFDVHSDQYLYNTALKINWTDFLTPDDTFAVFASVTNSRINHSKFAALRLKDAIADYFREHTHRRPSVDTRNPDIWFNLYIENNEAVISVDTSGGSLHRRGYRRESVQAPMVETLAASIIKLSGWQGKTALYDPFCGSGTLLCEAYLHLSQTPSAYLRKKFGFLMLPDFDPSLWKKVKTKGLKSIKPVDAGLIAGSDLMPSVTSNARDNCSVIDKQGSIHIKEQDAFSIPNLEKQTIVCNPPYGIRLEKKANLAEFYKNLGDFLKQRCKGSTAFIYFGDRQYIKNMGLKASWKKPLKNAKLDGRLVKYEMY